MEKLGVEDARGVVARFGPDAVHSALSWVGKKPNVRNPAGLVLAALEKSMIPAKKREVTAESISAAARIERERAAEAARRFYDNKFGS